MSEEEELGDYLAAEAVAAVLKEGDFEAFADLANLLEASRANEKAANLLLGIIWALPPDEAHDKMIATARLAPGTNPQPSFDTSWRWSRKRRSILSDIENANVDATVGPLRRQLKTRCKPTTRLPPLLQCMSLYLALNLRPRFVRFRGVMAFRGMLALG